jgi:Flp pilus assembly protein TadG
MIRPTTRSETRRAATIVETAFVLSVVLLFMFGIFEYARFVYLNQVMTAAAREGARYAITHTGDGTTVAQVQAYTTQQMAGRDSELAGYTVTVNNLDPNTLQPVPNANWSDAGFHNYIQVQITGTYSPMLPTFLQLPASIPLTATAILNSEAN